MRGREHPCLTGLRVTAYRPKRGVGSATAAGELGIMAKPMCVEPLARWPEAGRLLSYQLRSMGCCCVYFASGSVEPLSRQRFRSIVSARVWLAEARAARVPPAATGINRVAVSGPFPNTTKLIG